MEVKGEIDQKGRNVTLWVIWLNGVYGQLEGKRRMNNERKEYPITIEWVYGDNISTWRPLLHFFLGNRNVDEVQVGASGCGSRL